MKPTRAPPPSEPLGEPKHKFEDMFSAETALNMGFFEGLTDEQKKRALAYRGEENHGSLDTPRRMRDT